MEGRWNRDRRAESRQATDVLDWLGGRLQYLTRSIDACVCEPCHRRHARLLAKPTGQRPSRHVRPRRERAEVERKWKVFEHPIAKGSELVAARVWHEPFDELRLPSLTLWRSHETASSCVGSCGAEVAPNEVEGQVDPCGHTSRCEDVAVVDEEAVGQHVDPGGAGLELSGPPPVGRGGGGGWGTPPRRGENAGGERETNRAPPR